MRQYEFILGTYLVVGCLSAIIVADVTSAQLKTPTAAEGALASKIKCRDFRKSSEGQWTSRANTRLGKIDFSGHTFGVGEVDIGGADLATTLDRKCVAH